MKLIFKFYLIISLVTIIIIQQYWWHFTALIILNLFIFKIVTKAQKINKNIVLTTFYIAFVFAYIIKLQIYLIAMIEFLDVSPTLDILLMTTVSHIFVVFFMLFLTFFFSPLKYKLDLAYSGILGDKELMLIKLSIPIIIITSIIYYKYDLFVMGKEMEELPYHLNGLLFYTRTLFIPLILLSVLFTTEKSKIEYFAIISLITLGVSDMILRESKGALIYIVIQLFVIIYLKRSYLGIKINYKPFIVFSLILISIYPLMRNLRERPDDARVVNVKELMSDSDKLFIIEGALEITHRLQGFSEFYRIYTLTQHSKAKVDFDTSISETYTFNFLNQSRGVVNLSSPSLLGVSYMFFGVFGVLFSPIIYILCVFIIFKIYNSFLTVTQIPILAYSIFELINSTIAGTVDASFISLMIGFFFAILIELFFLRRSVATLKIIKQNN